MSLDITKPMRFKLVGSYYNDCAIKKCFGKVNEGRPGGPDYVIVYVHPMSPSGKECVAAFQENALENIPQRKSSFRNTYKSGNASASFPSLEAAWDPAHLPSPNNPIFATIETVYEDGVVVDVILHKKQ